MSSSNDDGDDGLAALFGGVTPQRAPRPDADVPPASEPVAPPAAQPVAPPGAQPVATPGAQPSYPGLAPAAQVTPPPFAPGAPAGGGYGVPAPTFGQQASQPPVAPQPTALPPYTPPTFDPVQYPNPNPNATPQPVGYPPTAQYPTESPAAEPPAYQPPRYPGLDPTTAYTPPPADPPYSQFAAPSLAPAATPQFTAPQFTAPPLTEPPLTEPPLTAPPFTAPPVSSYDAPSPAQSEYPPAASAPSYPTSSYPTSSYPTSSYPPPSFDPPAYQPPPLNAPTFDAPSYAAPAVDAPAFDARSYSVPAAQGYEPPASTSSSSGAEPVRAEIPPTPAVYQPLAGPLLPSSSAAIETPEDLGQSTTIEKVGVAVAILTGPIGLIVAIVSAVKSARRRGWVIGLVRASLVLGVISTLVVGVLGYVVWNLQAAALEHARLSAASADFCAAAVADPSMVQEPLLGWPSPGKTIQQSLDDMTTWTTRWTALASTSPPALADDLTLVASKGQQIIDSVTTARTIDIAGNQAVIRSAVSATGIPAWYQDYCVTP
ncbi:MAG: hypothetical protein ABIR17_03890 [Pseudolysinimonas sp.]|uniref:hypothetical protein n=1 Tax=Pseudolysinimonas sp. TaxID=2680009 RepID=UPI0032654896